MKQLRQLLVHALIAIATLPNIAFGEDYSEWLGREPKDISSGIKVFKNTCMLTNSSYFAKRKSPKEVAIEWTRSHCNCMAKFLQAKNDLLYVQTVNAELTGRLEAQGKAPKELLQYVDGYLQIFASCENDPNFEYVEDMNDSFDPESVPDPALNKPSMKAPNNPNGKLPFRPQKNPDKSRKINPDGIE